MVLEPRPEGQSSQSASLVSVGKLSVGYFSCLCKSVDLSQFLAHFLGATWSTTCNTALLRV